MPGRLGSPGVPILVMEMGDGSLPAEMEMGDGSTPPRGG